MVRAGKALVEGCEAAGIMVVRDGEVQTLAASDDVVPASDRMQGELREGPCFDATRNRHEVYRIADFSETPHQWPRYTPEARKLGIGSMMGFLLYTQGHDNLGALDLYSWPSPNAFGEGHEQVGWLLASHAAVAWSSARHAEHLHTAIETRQVIGEATGVMMQRLGLSGDDAFARLVRHSQNTNVKVRELAQTISDTGEILDGL